MRTSDFDYHLPTERIAQHSVEPRDSSQLLVLHRDGTETEHRMFSDIGEYLRAGDLLVMNDTKVFKARLRAAGNLEVFLVRPVGGGWLCLAKPGKKLHVGSIVALPEGVTLTVLEKHADGTVLVKPSLADADLIAFADRVGEIPIPPYVKEVPSDISKYQTAVARETGSVAAPTAAFHFTPRLIEELRAKGVRFAFVTLHVGLGTFLPVKTETLEEHPMHAEWVSIPPETAEAIADAKASGRRVIAVGTTTTRALEGAGVRTYAGDINIFIYPGYQFKVIDGLITNFHLPKSTLLALVSAFAGRERVMHAYEDAIKREYRFFSFGDGMLIL
jgi:S-adenosylmethionine:tRNA ribosyltransferase-isomerase